MAFEFASTKAF